MKIILGIGNPGPRYADTRHNIGYTVLDRLAAECGLAGWKKRFHSRSLEGTVRGARLILLKPETYVNESGRALRAAADWCGVAPEEIMVVVDDMNLPLGRLRVRPDGSSGGHNGLESVFSHMGTTGVPRLRIGIGGAAVGQAQDHVLSRFAPEERAEVEEAVQRGVDALCVWIEAGIERCQNEFNAKSGKAQDTNENEEADA
jgi:PTH1 family peptidyl-tRNA hydrolase